MNKQKRLEIRLLNALMTCLGVVVGGLVICGLLLVFTPHFGLPISGVGLNSSDTEEGTSNQTLLEEYEATIASGTATAETYLRLADLWIERGEKERATQVLRQGFEKTGDTKLHEKLVQLTGEPTEDIQQPKMLRKDVYDETGNLKWAHVYQYDEQGRLSDVTSYNATMTQTGHVDILYDDEGHKVQSYSWSDGGDSGDGQVEPIVCHYNTSGMLERQDIYHGDKLVCYTIYEYNQEGKESRCETYNSDGTMSDYTLSEYNESGQITRANTYSPDGELKFYSIWIYDTAGRNTAYKNYNPDGSEFCRDTYTYDEDGNIIQVEMWDLQTTDVAYIQYE